ncbi:EamA family transporter [Escherichia coli]
MESWPPLMMAGVRFLAAGILLLAFLLLRRTQTPPATSAAQCRADWPVIAGCGSWRPVTVAEHQNVPSGIAAVVVATVPLFTLCFSRLFGIKTRKLEWVGIAIGLAGIIMLDRGGNLSGNPWGAIVV